MEDIEARSFEKKEDRNKARLQPAGSNRMGALLVAGALGTGILAAPSEAQAEGPDVLGLRTRVRLRWEEVVRDSPFVNSVIIDGWGIHTSWLNDIEGSITAGTGVINTTIGFLNVGGGIYGANCPSNINAPLTNCPNNVSPQGGMPQAASLTTANFTAAAGLSLGPVTATANGALLFGPQSPSYLGLGKLAVTIFGDNGGGFHLSMDGQARGDRNDQLLSVGGALNFHKRWGTCGKGGRVFDVSVSNSWLAYTVVDSGHFDVVSYLNIGVGVENDKDCDAPFKLW